MGEDPFKMVQGTGGREPTMTEKLAPGDFVRNPAAPDWGIGRIQSVVGGRVTVNFEQLGKVVIDLAHVSLVPTQPEPGHEPGIWPG